MEKHIIMGVHITNRLKRAQDVQKVFTDFGCNIRTRLGLHQVQEDVCSSNGLVILELCGKDKDIAKMEKHLKTIEGIEVQKMVFKH